MVVPILVCKLVWFTVLLNLDRNLFVSLIHADIALEWISAKALEVFLQDLCGRTYEINFQGVEKTMNSLHL